MASSLSRTLRFPVAAPLQLARDVGAIAEAVGQLPSVLSGVLRTLGTIGSDVAVVRQTTLDLADRVGELEAVVVAVSARLDHVDEGLDRRVPDLSSLPAKIAHIEAGLDERIPDLTGIPVDITRITRDLARILELTPDPNEPGALEKVKDALTPNA